MQLYNKNSICSIRQLRHLILIMKPTMLA